VSHFILLSVPRRPNAPIFFSFLFFLRFAHLNFTSLVVPDPGSKWYERDGLSSVQRTARKEHTSVLPESFLGRPN